ncbi:hypothetical protein CERZMDRAFT_99913 [Cercospora zeae-maydis SCOH1-5]|uniref:SnoaL-like domain-containing protein n=1 Tax=Cercospora zeae-maydis SCOH1-5 TaxID=717836 RepID=A0A6A6F8Y2_9PEZI|nr:hypothetical protein CERZMDRAFT_99913 [Cercospora zeae-maydis SCOH1-5]
MLSGLPYTDQSGLPVSEESLKTATAELSTGAFGNTFDVNQAPWNYAAPDFQATTSLSEKKTLQVSELLAVLQAAHRELSDTSTRVLTSHAQVHGKKDSAECYEILEVRTNSSTPSKPRQYMTKAVWKRQIDGRWRVVNFSLTQRPEGATNSTFTTGLHTPPETPGEGSKPSRVVIGDTLQDMTAQYSQAINSHQFDISQPPWSYIKRDKFRASMPPAEDHKMTLEEMVKFLAVVCEHSPTAHSTILDSNVVVKEHIGWAEVWQNLELRDTARSKGVVHSYIEKMVWERQHDGAWLAVEYKNIQGLDRAGLPR